MGRILARATLIIAACFAVSCTTQPGSGSLQGETRSPRLMAGQALMSCTVSGERPVKAEASALCGTLTVPEDRSNPRGRQVSLRVAVVPATAAVPAPDPLFVLAGGPKEAATQFFAWLPGVFTQVHATRDIVLVDQRGTGGSNALQLAAMPDTVGLPEDRAEAVRAEWARKALTSLGADPRFYTTTVAADDLDVVREALGYHKIDVYGTSYGGTVAQYYLRQHEDRVRVAVLDGSTPLDVPVFELMAANSQSALDLLLGRCARDVACHEAFPRLADEWTALVERLATPVTVVDPASGDTAVIDQRLFADAIHAALLTEATAALVPLVIHLAHDNRWVEAAQVLSAPQTGGPTLLMSEEILCSEAWARFDPAEVARRGAGSYDLTRELANAQQRAVKCRHLPAGLVPANDDAATRTDTPMLWLAADGDPQDPPANLTAVRDQQSNSRVVIVPAQQHVVGHLDCMPTLIAAFLDSGRANQLDVTCATSRLPTLSFRLK